MKSFASSLMKEKPPEILGNFILTETDNLRTFAKAAFASKFTSQSIHRQSPIFSSVTKTSF